MLYSNVTERNIAKVHCESSKLSPTATKCCDIFFLVRLESACRRPPTIRKCASCHDEIKMKVSWELCYRTPIEYTWWNEAQCMWRYSYLDCASSYCCGSSLSMILWFFVIYDTVVLRNLWLCAVTLHSFKPTHKTEQCYVLCPLLARLEERRLLLCRLF